MQFIYRLYLLLFGPIIFFVAGLIVCLQIIISPIIWVFTGKGLTDFPPLGVIILKKLTPPIYEYFDKLF